MTKEQLSQANEINHKIRDKTVAIEALRKMSAISKKDKSSVTISHSMCASVSLSKDWSYVVIDFAIEMLTQELISLEDKFKEL